MSNVHPQTSPVLDPVEGAISPQIRGEQTSNTYNNNNNNNQMVFYGDFNLDDNENVNTQLTLHHSSSPHPNSNNTLSVKQNPLAIQYPPQGYPTNNGRMNNNYPSADSSMTLLHNKLTSEYDRKHQLVELESLYARVKQDVDNKRQRLVEIKQQNDESEVKIETTESKIDEDHEIQSNWKSNGEAVLKKRLESLKRDSVATNKRKQRELDDQQSITEEEMTKNDLHLDWLQNTLPQHLKESSRQQLDQIAVLEAELAEYQRLKDDMFPQGNQMIGNNKNTGKNDLLTSSISNQKQHVARLKKQLDDLKHELLPWHESLQRIQSSLIPLRHYPLNLANALLEMKIPAHLRRDYRQENQQSQDNVHFIQDYSGLLSTTPFMNDMQLVDICPTSQAPLGQLSFPTDQDVYINLKMFDFPGLLSQWLIPELRIEYEFFDENVEEGENNSSVLRDVSSMFGDDNNNNNNNNKIHNDHIDFDTSNQRNSNGFNLDEGNYNDNDETSMDTDLNTTTTTTTTNRHGIDSRSPLNNNHNNNNMQETLVVATPSSTSSLSGINLTRQKTLKLPPVVEFPQTGPDGPTVFGRTLDKELVNDPLFLWKYDLSAYLVPTYNNALRLLQRSHASQSFDNDNNDNNDQQQQQYHQQNQQQQNPQQNQQQQQQNQQQGYQYDQFGFDQQQQRPFSPSHNDSENDQGNGDDQGQYGDQLDQQHQQQQWGNNDDDNSFGSNNHNDNNNNNYHNNNSFNNNNLNSGFNNNFAQGNNNEGYRSPFMDENNTNNSFNNNNNFDQGFQFQEWQ